MNERQHHRVEDKATSAGRPEIEGLPEEEGVDRADIDERLDEDPESVANRRDVPNPPTETVTPPAAEQ